MIEVGVVRRNISTDYDKQAEIIEGEPAATEERVVNQCSERDISLLTASIKKNPHSGLFSWSSPENPDMKFSGLDQNLLEVFRGQRILVLGDSTMWNFYGWMYQLLVYSPLSLARFHLSTANKVLMRRSGCHYPADPHPQTAGVVCDKLGPQHLQHQLEGTRLDDGTWVKYSNTACSLQEENVVETRTNLIRDFRPNIIVANIGLHLLHFQDYGRDTNECHLEKWINYEGWLEDIVVAAENAGTEYLLFKTTNSICSKRYISKFVQGTKSYTRKRTKTISRCIASVREGTALTIGTNAIRDYCKNGIFNDVGSQHLNRRLFKFVDARKNSTSIKLAVFNDHDVQSCVYTPKGDGRHYHMLNLVRIRILANLLNCMN